MSGTPATEAHEKRMAALLSVGSAALLVSLKTFLVYRTGSLGVLSEALHSGLISWRRLSLFCPCVFRTGRRTSGIRTDMGNLRIFRRSSRRDCCC